MCSRGAPADHEGARRAPFAPPSTPRVAAELVHPLIGALRELGHDPIAHQLFESDARWLAATHLERLWDRAATVLHDDHVALSVLARLPAGTLGLLDHALVTADCLRAGLGLLARYLPVLDESLAFDLVIEEPYATVVLSRPPTAPPCRHADELALAWLVDRMRHVLVRPAVVSSIGLVAPRPATARVLERFFAAEISFDAPRRFLRFPAATLDEPSRTAASGLAAAVTDALTRLAAEDPFVVRVHAHVAACITAPTIEAIAAELGTSTRSLQRELQDRGQSFRTIVDHVRCAHALSLIRTSGLGPRALADALGYQDPTAFLRAFRRWTGLTPQDYQPAGSRALR